MRHGAALIAAALAASAATASAAAPNPSANMPLATPASCSAPTSTACETAVVAGLDSAHTALGLGAYTLPADFDSLPPDEQLFILSDSDRVAYGLPPISGLSATLNSAAQAGVADDNDPDPQADLPSDLGDYGFSSNWAGGYANDLLAYYGWMYDDGLGGPNIDCQSAGDPGCWGHRQDILAFPDGCRLGDRPLRGTRLRDDDRLVHGQLDDAQLYLDPGARRHRRLPFLGGKRWLGRGRCQWFGRWWRFRLGRERFRLGRERLRLGRERLRIARARLRGQLGRRGDLGRRRELRRRRRLDRNAGAVRFVRYSGAHDAHPKSAGSTGDH
jgi:hypothetical protein